MNAGGRCVVVVDHGSRRREANLSVERLAERLAETTGERVEAAHMELADPLYEDRLRDLAHDGTLRELVVLPLFFVAGKHLVEDIHGPADALREAHPDLTVTVLPPMVEQDRFLDYLAGLVEGTGGNPS